VAVLFEDEVTVQLTPTLCRQWGFATEQPQAGSWTGTHQKVHVCGGLNPVTGQLHHRFVPRLTTACFQQFCQQLLRAYRARLVVLILDGAPWHRSASFFEFVLSQPRLGLCFLPPYSPDLMPVEPVWKWLRREVTHNHYFERLGLLKRAVTGFCWRRRSHASIHRLLTWCRNIC
jgi:transposase